MIMHYGPTQAIHPDAMTYKRAADAFRRKDLETVGETIHDDIAWHVPGTSWMAREIQGRDALMSYFKELLVRTGHTFILEDVAISGTDHHLVAVQRIGARFNGETRVFPVVSVMRYENGRQIERWLHMTDLTAFDGFFSQFA